MIEEDPWLVAIEGCAWGKGAPESGDKLLMTKRVSCPIVRCVQSQLDSLFSLRQ